jgi:signal transduction histidine kinase
MSRRPIIPIIAFFVAYVATGRLGAQLGGVGGVVALLWPPTGLALVLLLGYGLRATPAVAIAALTLNLLNGTAPLAALGISTGNTLEAMLAVWLLDRRRFDRGLNRVRDVVALVGVCAISSALSATIGTACLWAADLVTSATLTSAWAGWWLANELSAIVVAPVMLVWLYPPPRMERSRLELVGLLMGLAISAAALSFTEHAYLAWPTLVWAALRFRQRGAATSVFIIGVVAAAATVLGRGAFVQASVAASLVQLQGFMGVTATTALLLGSAIGERDGAVVARDDFLSVASHELRTPLTSLKLHVEILRRAAQRGGDAMTPDKVVTKVADIEQQTDRLAALVSEVLDVSRAVAGRFALDLQDMDLSQAAADATKRLEPQAQNAGCELKLTTEPCAGTWDRVRVDQVLVSLITNAIKFGPGQPVEVTVKAKPDEAVVSVRDHGIGIKPADKERIFERFERAVSMRHFGGLGLGLWLTRQVVDAQGGSISVKSEPGQGSEFIVVLPRRPSSLPAQMR